MKTIGCFIAGALLAASGALADDKLITRADPEVILSALEKGGFEGEITKDDEDDPLIRSTDENQPFSIHFYGCEDHADCKFVQFTAGWNLKQGIKLEKVEEWNENKVWGQAYRDKDKDPWLALPINFVGGVSMDYLLEMIDWWGSIYRGYEKHIGWTK